MPTDASPAPFTLEWPDQAPYSGQHDTTANKGNLVSKADKVSKVEKAIKSNKPVKAAKASKVAKVARAADPDSALADAVRTSAQQIWQAGLGAFVKAQKEGSNDFRTLVREGTDLQQRSRALADGEAIAEHAAAGASAEHEGSWDKLEQVFEERVARALSTIGVPNQKDIQQLSLRIEELSRVVLELTQQSSVQRAQSATPARPAAAPRVAKKPRAAP